MKSESLGLGGVLSILAKTWPYIREYRGRLALIVTLIIGGLTVLVFCVIKGAHWIFDIIPGISPLGPGDALMLGLDIDADPITILDRITWVLFGMVIFGVTYALTLSAYVIYIFQRIAQDFRTNLYNRFQAFSLMFHADQQVGDTIYRLMMDSPVITSILNVLVILPLRAVGMTFVTVLIMMLISWRLAMIFIVSIPITAGAGVIAGRLLLPAFRSAREKSAGFMTQIEESLTFFKVLKMSSREADSARWFEKAGWSALAAARRARLLLVSYRTATFILGGLGIIAINYFGAHEVWAGRAVNGLLQMPPFELTVMSLGVLLAIRSLFRMGSDTLRTFFDQWGVVQDTVVALDRVYEFLFQAPEIRDAEDAVDCPDHPEKIEFDDVCFSYRPGTPILKNIRLKAESGTITAIAGPTGAGKTTLANMIPRFMDPQSGAVKINGRDIKDYTLNSLRKRISIALQENFIFTANFTDNIRYGHPEADDEAVERAATVAGLHDFITGCPDGYASQVGEKGCRISVGQRQQVGIARAIIMDAPILILDEPTADLDPLTENKLVKNLEKLKPGRMIFIIAHRLSTIRRADRILFMEDGEIVERGTHDELIADPDGKYRRYVTTWAGGIEG